MNIESRLIAYRQSTSEVQGIATSPAVSKRATSISPQRRQTDASSGFQYLPTYVHNQPPPTQRFPDSKRPHEGLGLTSTSNSPRNSLSQRRQRVEGAHRETQPGGNFLGGAFVQATISSHQRKLSESRGAPRNIFVGFGARLLARWARLIFYRMMCAPISGNRSQESHPIADRY